MNAAMWVYIVLAYAITWSVTIGFYILYKMGSISIDTLNIVYNLGALGPFIAAIVCAKRYYGNAGLKKLLATFNFRSLNRASLLLSFSPLVFLLVGFLTYPLFK